jgi:N-acetylglucosamine kinase-like BadF-type ATPase
MIVIKASKITMMSSNLRELEVRKSVPTVMSRVPRAQWWVVGVDGGGTGTRAVIMDQKQRVLGEGHAGPSNPLRVGIAKAATTVREAIDRACADASIHRDDIAIATVGLAGVRRKDIHQCTLEKLHECLKEIPSIELLPDGELALFGATDGKPGLVVIAGTGSICCGRNKQGKQTCAGGWGPIVGDEGGASWITRQALQAVAHGTDGRGPATALTSAALRYFKVAIAEDLSTAVYSPTMTNDRLAGFAREVVGVAKAGDQVSIEILRDAGRELGDAAVAVARKLNMEKDEFPVACVGGVYGAGDLVLDAMRERIRSVAKRAFLAEPLFPPVIAAARIAHAHLRDEYALAG